MEAIRAARYQRQLDMGLIDPKWKLSGRDAEAWKDAKKQGVGNPSNGGICRHG